MANADSDSRVIKQMLEEFVAGHKEKSIRDFTSKVYKKMKELNIDVIYDDRESKLGNKLNDWELMGIPKVLIIGSKEVKNNVLTLKDRLKDTKTEINADEVYSQILK